MYDWNRIIEDKVPCYFWDTINVNTERHVSILRAVESYFITAEENCTGNFYYNYDGGRYHNCEPIRTEDKEAYKIKEPVKVWRPCKTREEFMQFMGKIAINKNRKADDILRLICYLEKGDGRFSTEWWFNSYTLEDGSPIGIEEVQ